MGYWKALSYLGLVTRIGTAVVRYLRDKDEKKLAGILANAIYDGVGQATQGKAMKKVDRQKAIEAAQALASVIEDVV